MVFTTNATQSFTVSPYTYTTTFIGNTTTINGNGIYAPMTVAPALPDTPEAWLRRRVQEVCELAQVA